MLNVCCEMVSSHENKLEQLTPGPGSSFLGHSFLCYHPYTNLDFCKNEIPLVRVCLKRIAIMCHKWVQAWRLWGLNKNQLPDNTNLNLNGEYKAQTGFVPPWALRLDTVQCIVMPGLNKECLRELQARKNDKGLKTLLIFVSILSVKWNEPGFHCLNWTKLWVFMLCMYPLR